MSVVKQRILAAYLTRNEVLGQAQLLSAISNPSEKAQFWEAYSVARNELAKIEPLPAAPPALSGLPSAAQGYVRELEATSAFQDGFGGFRYQFLWVPLDRITPVQIFCNLEPPLPPPPSGNLKAALEYALPKEASVPGEVMITPTGVRFSTPRYGLGPQHVRRRVENARVVLTFEHPNLVQIRKVGNLLVLLNGTHRALEMLRAGHSKIPAIVIEHQTPNEIEWPQGPGFWTPQFLFASPRQPGQGARPPLIPDLLSNLSVECPVSLVPSVVELNIGPPQPSQPVAGQPIAIQLGGIPGIVPH